MASADSFPLAATAADFRDRDRALVLAIDTCGPSGSAALGWVPRAVRAAENLGQVALEGRSYSATLVTAIDELLARFGFTLRDIGALVAVNGPGSFTGVRVGLAAVKGLANAAGMPIVAVSRLEVLAATANLGSAALDAHRCEVFLRIAIPGGKPRELLAGAEDLAAISPIPPAIAACDDAAASLVHTAWPSVTLTRCAAPSAADAIVLAAPLLRSGAFIDPLVLDGNYLRRSDAEIFGQPAPESQGRR